MNSFRIIQTAPLADHPTDNGKILCDHVRAAIADNIDVVVFPFGAITGMWPGARLNSKFFRAYCADALQQVAKQTARGAVTVILGDYEGHSERVLRVIAGERVRTVTIADDGFTVLAKPDLIVHLPSARYVVGLSRERQSSLAISARVKKLPAVSVAGVGVELAGKNLCILPGNSCAFDSRGDRIGRLPPFATGELTLSPDDPAIQTTETTDAQALSDAIRYAAQAWVARQNIRHVVVGVSGGIDSAVSAALYASFLPPGALTLVNLPGPFTSQLTRDLAKNLAENLGLPLASIDITRAVNATRDELVAAGFNVTSAVFENIQARHRGHLLAAIAASKGGVFTCNSNKTEAAVGYGTLYGDLAGWLSLLGDLWKGQVYDVARQLNTLAPIIPKRCFTLKPSAELSEAQDVTQQLGDPFDYPYHDALFRSWVEGEATMSSCKAMYDTGTLAAKIGLTEPVPFGRDKEAFNADLRRWWNLYNGMGAVKRLQTPPVLALSNRALDESEHQIPPRDRAAEKLP